MWKAGLGLHLAGVQSLVSEACLSIMGSFVVRAKVADMMCGSQLSCGRERGRPLKLTMNLYTQTTGQQCMAVHESLGMHCDADRKTHAHTCTCVKDMAGDRGW